MKNKVFIHILWNDDLKFNGKIVKFFHKEKIRYKNSDHYFITPYINVYNELKQYNNIRFYKTDNTRSAALINLFAPKCDYIISHGMCNRIEFIKRRYLKKIIWRTWGWNTIANQPQKQLSWKYPLKYMLAKYVKNCVNNFAGIGIANNVDKIEIQKKFSRSIPIFRMPYPNEDNQETILDRYTNNENKFKDSNINIMVGHFGYNGDNHIKVLEQLKKFENDSIKIYIVLSYGDDQYIKTVKQYVKKNCKSKIKIIEDFLPYQQYLDLLNTMDIAIFDGTYSYALGNIAILLYFKKKIFLNRNGVIAEAFKAEHIPFEYTDSISNMTFSDFSKPIVYDSDSWKKLSIHTYDQCIEEWNDVIKYYANK